MRVLVILLAWIAFIPAAFARPYVGVMLWSWTAFLAPNVYLYGALADVPFNKIIAVVTLITLFLSQEPKKITWNPTLVLLLILLIHGTVSYMLSGDNPSAPEIYSKFWKEILFCILVSITVTSRLRLHCLLGISAIALSFPGVTEGLKVFASGGGHHIPFIATFGDANQGALALLMVLPVLYYLSRQSVDRTVKYAYLGAMALTSLAVVGTWSRGGLVGLGVMAIAFVVMSKNKLRSLALVCLIVSMILSVASVQYFQRIETIGKAGGDVSLMGRVLAWKVSFAIATHNPVFGIGFHGIQAMQIWNRYVTQVTVPEVFEGYEVRGFPKAAHSIYFEVLGDLGFVGFGLFMSIICVGFYNTRIVLKFSKSKPGLEWMYDLGITFRLMLIVYCVSGAAVSMAWFELSFLTFTLTSILVRFCREMEMESISVMRRDKDAAAVLGRGPVGGPLVASSSFTGPLS